MIDKFRFFKSNVNVAISKLEFLIRVLSRKKITDSFTLDQLDGLENAVELKKTWLVLFKSKLDDMTLAITNDITPQIDDEIYR